MVEHGRKLSGNVRDKKNVWPAMAVSWPWFAPDILIVLDVHTTLWTRTYYIYICLYLFIYDKDM